MGETPRRSGFRLPWESGEAKQADARQEADAAPAADASGQPERPETAAQNQAELGEQPQGAAGESSAAAGEAQAESSPFLRELVDAMRGVAESSRDSNMADLRASLDERVEELNRTAAERAEDLRRRSETDVTGIGEWERSEIDRVRKEAEQRRDARRAKLERELADHQANADGEVEAARKRLSDYEREVSAFFAELAEIQDPAAFVAAAKRMPAPPDLKGSAPSARANGLNGSAAATGVSPAAATESLTERLAQLDERLAEAASVTPATEPSKEPTSESSAAPIATPAIAAASSESTGTPAPAATTPAAPAVTGGETSTPIVVKGLGSFGAITSFKQALERVDGVKGVTLSLGPTGEFVYRASHTPEFDIVAAIRDIEGQGVGIQHSEGSVLVTIERQR